MAAVCLEAACSRALYITCNQSVANRTLAWTDRWSNYGWCHTWSSCSQRTQNKTYRRIYEKKDSKLDM